MSAQLHKGKGHKGIRSGRDRAKRAMLKDARNHRLIITRGITGVSEPYAPINPTHAGRKSIRRGLNTISWDVRQSGKAGPDYLIP